MTSRTEAECMARLRATYDIAHRELEQRAGTEGPEVIAEKATYGNHEIISPQAAVQP